MNVFQAIVMGLVQGLGEFLPISSSAHLVLVPWLFNWHDPGLTYDIALHIGTLFAVLIYFWKDWVNLITNGLTAARSPEGRLFWYLVLATIPGAVGGYLLEDMAETIFRHPLLIAAMLILLGLLLYWADVRSSRLGGSKEIRLKTSLIIGFSQVFAVIPGVSRSGVTMTAGLFAGLNREQTARFSFLLSTPIILGAGLIKVPQLLADPSALNSIFFIGMLVSAITGILSIGFLMRFIQTKTFRPFSYYRFILGAVVILVFLARG